MKTLVLLLTLVSSLSSFGQSWHNEVKTFDDAMEYIQQNFSYHCRMEIKLKRKMFFNCTTDNAMTFIKVKLSSRKGDVADRVEKVTFEFLNSEDGKYTITNSYNNLSSKFSYVCGSKRMKVKRNGFLESKWDCKVRNLGKLFVETKVNTKPGMSNPIEEFKITFSKK